MSSPARKGKTSKKKVKMEVELSDLSDDNKNSKLVKMKSQRRMTKLGTSINLNKLKAPEAPETKGG